MTNEDYIHCSCNHLSAFGGQLLVAPTPIDFDKVFTELVRLPDSGNLAVIIAVGCVFGLYLGLLLWARRNDKLDLVKVKMQFLIITNMCGQKDNWPLSHLRSVSKLAILQDCKLLIPSSVAQPSYSLIATRRILLNEGKLSQIFSDR